jgi:hypothetical protein
MQRRPLSPWVKGYIVLACQQVLASSWSSIYIRNGTVLVDHHRFLNRYHSSNMCCTGNKNAHSINAELEMLNSSSIYSSLFMSDPSRRKSVMKRFMDFVSRVLRKKPIKTSNGVSEGIQGKLLPL